MFLENTSDRKVEQFRGNQSCHQNSQPNFSNHIDHPSIQAVRAPDFTKEEISLKKLSKKLHDYVTPLHALYCVGDDMYLSTASPLLLRDQIAAFTTAMGPALSTVTTLHLTTRSNSHDHLGEREPASAPFIRRLAQLASACSSLHNLYLQGCFPEEILEALGAASSQVTLLVMETVSLRIPVLQRLQQLLPDVRTLYLCRAYHHLSHHEEQDHMRVALAALASSTSITFLNLGGCHMEKNMWAHLPTSLKVLVTDEDFCLSRGPAPGVSLPNLERLAWETHVEGLSELLHAAPNMKAMECVFEVRCNPSSLPAWSTVCEKTAAATIGDISVRLRDDEDIGEFATFLAAAKPMTAVSLVEFSPEDISDDVDCLKHLARVFPNMGFLRLNNLAVKDASLQALLACHSLVDIHFNMCNNITATGAGMLAARHFALKSLVFDECERIVDDDIALLVQLMHIYDLPVKIYKK